MGWGVALVLGVVDRHGAVVHFVRLVGRVDHGDDGDGQVDAQHVVEHEAGQHHHVQHLQT